MFKLFGKQSSKIAALAAAMVAANSGIVRAEVLHPFPGPNTPEAWNKGIAQEHVGVHKKSDEFWTESWYFMVQLPADAYLFNHFTISNAGFGDFTGAVETTIVYPDGRVVFEKEKIDSSDMSYDNAKGEVKFGDMGLMHAKPGSFHISVKGEKIQYEFMVRNQAPGYRPGDGVTYFGKDKKTYYDLTILTPNGTATGKATYEGKTVAINGMVYGDHSHQDHPPHKLAQRLFSMRDFDAASNSATDLLVFVPPADYGKDARVANLIVAQGNKINFAARNLLTTEKEFTADPQLPSYKTPKVIELTNVPGEPAVKGTITITKQLQRQDAIADANFVERTAIKMFGLKPILYRFEAKYDIQYEGGSSTGTALVEYLLMRKQDE